jgi:hypothetical protein
MAWTDDKIRFIWSTDEHIPANMTDGNVAAMIAAVDDCNTWLPNAYISTGDVGNSANLHVQRAMSLLWRLQRPLYICPGNHDLVEGANLGNPDIAALASETEFNRPAPFYYSTQLVSGDGTVKARCLFLDCNYYADDPDGGLPGNNPYHSPGDPAGTVTGDAAVSGGYHVMLPQHQLDWIAATLAADVTSQFVLVFIHYTPLVAHHVVNYPALCDVLWTDGRPAMGFCGHIHADAIDHPQTTTDTLHTFHFYQLCAMLDSHCWCRVTLGWSGSAITIDGMEIHNFTQPGALTINAPFTSV